MRQVLAATMFLPLVLAGCTSVQDSAEDGLPSLAPFAECRWTYPDGEPIPCDGDTIWLPEETERGTDWACVFRADVGGGYFTVLYVPTLQQHAIEFWAPYGGNYSGVVSVDGVFYNWTGAGPSGSYLLDRDFGALSNYTFMVYESWVESEDPRLDNASVHQSWSWRNGEGWAVHHVDVPDVSQELLFYKRVPTPFGGETSSSTYTDNVQGFNTTFYIKPKVGGRFTFDQYPGWGCWAEATDRVPDVPLV